MMLVARESSATSFAEASRSTSASRKRLLLVEDTAELRIPSCYKYLYTSRKRRKGSPSRVRLMETRRNTYCYQHGGRATTRACRNSSRRSASARHAPLLHQHEEQHMHQYDAWSGHVGTEYLGVSNVAFAPPLRRYLESPQHGRHALRSSKPSASRLSSGLLGSRVRARAESAGMEAKHARRPISRGNTSRRGGAACPEVYRYDHFSSCSTALSGENHECSTSLEELRSGSEHTPGTSPRHRLLTPVGPDWWEHDSPRSSSDVDAPTRPARTELTDENANFEDEDHSAGDGGGARATLSRNGESLDVRDGISSGGCRTIDDEDSKGSRHTSQRWEEGSTRPDEDNKLGEVTKGGRASIRRHRIPRSNAWDLLTGRRVEPGRRKGSYDIRLSQVSRFLSAIRRQTFHTSSDDLIHQCLGRFSDGTHKVPNARSDILHATRYGR